MVGSAAVLRPLRTLGRAPSFTLAVVGTLALGVGAVTTIFSVATALMLRPLPGIAAPDRLVRIDGETRDLAYADVVELRAALAPSATLAAHKAWRMDVRVAGETRRVHGALVGANYFAVLGVVPMLGRGLAADEEANGRGPHLVAVISHDLWMQRFTGDSDVVGRSIGINGHLFSIVGVAPRDFHGSSLFEVEDAWVPLDAHREVAPGLIASVRATGGDERWLGGIARLAPGSTIASVRARLAAVVAVRGNGRDAGASRLVVSGLLSYERAEMRGFFAVLLVIVGAVFLVACANVASLVLARSAARVREFAIRAAVGASRLRLAREIAVEQLLLAGAGSAAGLFVATALARAIELWLRANVKDFPAWVSMAPDGRVLAFTIVLTMCGALLFGLAPVVTLSRIDLVTGLKGGVHTGRRRFPLGGRALVWSQVAAALAFTVLAGSLARTLRLELNRTEVRAPDAVLTAVFDPSNDGIDVAESSVRLSELVDRVAELPGVDAVGVARNSTPRDRSFFTEAIHIPGATGADSVVEAGYDVVSPGYFAVVGVRATAGRVFSEGDRAGALPAIVVNRAFANRVWPGANVVGKRVRLWQSDVREIVGVVPDRSWGGDPAAFVYFPIAQPHPWPRSAVILHLRARGDARALADPLRRIAGAVAPATPLLDTRLLSDRLARELVEPRLAAAIVGAAALLAVLLSAVGLYGLLSFTVARRTRELGVRGALGATSRRIVGEVVADGMSMTGIGLAAGLAIALVGSPIVLRAMFENAPRSADLLSIASAVCVLAFIGLLACLVPALRAARVHPSVALRTD